MSEEVDVEAEIIDFCNMIELSNRQCDALLEALPQIYDLMNKEKASRKRGKTPYQRFMSLCIKGRDPGEAVTEAMKRCAREWKEKGD